MNNEMSLPPFYDLIRILAVVGAVLGCIVGAVSMIGGLGMFQYGTFMGLTALVSGAMTILGSLAGLGGAFCLLAIVQATIDTRNATLRYVARSAASDSSIRSTDWLADNGPTLD